MTEFKGSILELNKYQAIIMTDNCDFVTVKRLPHMFVGQQMVFKKTDIRGKNFGLIKYAALAVSIFLLCFVSVMSFQLFQPSTVYAYIDIDINPSLEFTIDKSAKVLGVKALNADATILCKDLNLVDIPVKQALSKVIATSINKGFISEEKQNKVLISATVNKKTVQKPYEEKALDSILIDIQNINIKIGSASIEPEVLKVSAENRESALKNNISMGRYELYKKIKEKNPDITIEKAKSKKVYEMLEKAEIKGAKVKPGENKNKKPDRSSSDESMKIDEQISTSENFTDKDAFKPETKENPSDSVKVDKSAKDYHKDKKPRNEKDKDNKKPKDKPTDKSSKKNDPKVNSKDNNTNSQSDSDRPKSYNNKPTKREDKKDNKSSDNPPPNVNKEEKKDKKDNKNDK